MVAAEQHQVRQLRLAAVCPMVDVMRVDESALRTAGELAAVVAAAQRPADRRRDRPCLAPDAQRAPVPFGDVDQRRVARKPARGLRCERRPALQLAGTPRLCPRSAPRSRCGPPPGSGRRTSAHRTRPPGRSRRSTRSRRRCRVRGGRRHRPETSPRKRPDRRPQASPRKRGGHPGRPRVSARAARPSSAASRPRKHSDPSSSHSQVR